MFIMKKVLFTLLLVCLVFFSFAKGKEMKLKNNVKIINTELLSVLQTTVIPNMPRESNDEGIWVYYNWSQIIIGELERHFLNQCYLRCLKTVL